MMVDREPHADAQTRAPRPACGTRSSPGVRGDDSEGGAALLSAMIFMIIMAGLSVVLLSTVLGQTVPSVAAQRNTKTIYAAQAGMQASLAMLRSAAAAPDASGKVYGSLSQLKCSRDGAGRCPGERTQLLGDNPVLREQPLGEFPLPSRSRVLHWA